MKFSCCQGETSVYTIDNIYDYPLDIQENSRAVYGYDEFGQDLFGNQGDMQPFGYTGYQKDEVANTYFAQAREYIPLIGGFISRDIKKGNILHTMSLMNINTVLVNPLIMLIKMEWIGLL